jgi:hypothetical protein
MTVADVDLWLLTQRFILKPRRANTGTRSAYATFLGWLASILCHGRLPRVSSSEKSARYVCSLHSPLECPRSWREVLSVSGCRPPQWRFSVKHSRDDRREIPCRSARYCGQQWPLVFVIPPLSFSPRWQCSMATLSKVRRSCCEGGPAWSAPLRVSR